MEPTGTQRKCVAATFLPANCSTAIVRVADVLRCRAGETMVDRYHGRGDGPPGRMSTPGKKAQQLLLSTDDGGRLVCVDGRRCAAVGCGCWTLSVPLADDCHAYNCRLELSAGGGAVGLRTAAAVLPGQPLRMWFPPDLQLMLHVPFLTPVNIRDERKYVCHECGYACEKPNPLKIHLALDCGTLPRAELWSRLAVAATADSDDEQRTIEASFRFSLTPAGPARAPSLLSSSSACTESAFRPYSPESSASSGPAGPPSPAVSLPARPPLLSADEPLHRRRRHYQEQEQQQPPPPHRGDATFFARRCAEMETIVSNLGHSDQGHLCIYCGKVYSRKYGLKIHIRTHTGFKPLKCKYCYRPFGDPSNLNKHVRLHAEGDTPYKCECCGKILVRKRDLDRHMKSRHSQIIPKTLFKMHVPV